MFTKFIFSALFLLLLFSCRKDEIIVSEYIEIIVDHNENNTTQFKDPQVFLEEDVLRIAGADNHNIEFYFGENSLQSGFNHPVKVLLPFGFCDDNITNKHCKENVTLNIINLAKVDEFLLGELKGKLWIQDVLTDIDIKFHLILDDEYQKICGQLWYDVNENNLFDSNERGINGVEVEAKANGNLISSKTTGIKRGDYKTDGYFELNASTKYLNDIKILLPSIGLKFVEKNYGNNPDKDSDFDTNGQILGLRVTKGEKLKLDAGVKVK